MTRDKQKTKSGYIQVCRLVAMANGNCNMDTTKDGLLLSDASFYGTLNGDEFECDKIEILDNGIILFGVVQNCQLSCTYGASNHCNMVAFVFGDIEDLKIDDIERLIY